jgi:hypothetical protein
MTIIFEIIPSDPKEALVFYKARLEKLIKENKETLEKGYQLPLLRIELVFNCLQNIRSLKKRIEK